MSINLTSQHIDGKSGPITATITTQSVAAKDALTSQASELKNSLSASGIKLDKLEINTTDKTIAAPSSNGFEKAAAGAMQSNTSGQQFGSNQHNSSGSHTGQGVSSAMSDQNRGNQNPQQQAFASMLSGDGNFGRGGNNTVVNTPQYNIENDENIPATISGNLSNTVASGINILA
jgi:hypothetical protein